MSDFTSQSTYRQSVPKDSEVCKNYRKARRDK